MACPIGNDFAPTLFSDAQLAELAFLLNVDKSAMCPLCRAGAAISIWRSTSPALSMRGTKDALVKNSKDLTSAVEAVRALDMLGHAQAEADGAIRVWVKRNRKRIVLK
jgi:hypothetical protein